MVQRTLHRLLTPWYCPFFDRKVMSFSAGQRTSTYGCCDSSWCTITALASMIPRSLVNWTRMGHDEAGTYSFSRDCNSHSRFATTGARCLEQSIAGWHSASLWSFACENTLLRCCQRRVHCLLMWLFGTSHCDICVSLCLDLLYIPTMIN